jgi:predicted MFS family arabinose efflux permease
MFAANRNLLYVVIARFVSRLGGSAVWFIGTMGVAAYVFEATPRQLAIMSAINGVAAIVGSLTAGVLIDRFGPRKVMIGAEIGSIPPVLWMMVAPTLPLFVLGSAGFSLFGIPTWTAGASFAPYIVEGRKQLERANAYIEGGSAVGFVLGPAVGALVASLVSQRSVFWVMIIASVVAAAAAWRTRIDETPREHVRGGAWRDFKDGLNLAYTTRSLRYFIAMGTAVWFGFGAFQALESLFYRDVVGVGVEWLGWMNTAFGIGLVSGAALLPRLPAKVVSARGLAFFTMLAGLGTVLYVGSTDLRLIALGAAVWGSFLGALEPLLRTLIHLDSPHEFVGRIVGTMQWHRSAGELIPLAFVPALAVSIGIQETLIAGGVLVALAAIAGIGTARSIDRQRPLSGLQPPVPEPVVESA